MEYPKLKLTLNTVSIKAQSLTEKIKIAMSAGYRGIGLYNGDMDQYLNNGGTIEELKKFIAGEGAEISELMAIKKWFQVSKDKWNEAQDEARRKFEDSRILGCSCVTTPCYGKLEGRNEWIERYAKICGIAEEFGQKVAFEFLGSAPQTKTLSDAWEIVRAAESSSAGFLIDVFHFYKGESSIEEFKKIPGEKISLIHINDIKSHSGLPKEELKDGDRVFPGQGVSFAKNIIDVAIANGYQGYYSLELFNKEYWERDPFEIAKEGLETSLNVLGGKQ